MLTLKHCPGYSIDRDMPKEIVDARNRLWGKFRHQEGKPRIQCRDRLPGIIELSRTNSRTGILLWTNPGYFYYRFWRRLNVKTSIPVTSYSGEVIPTESSASVPVFILQNPHMPLLFQWHSQAVTRSLTATWLVGRHFLEPRKNELSPLRKQTPNLWTTGLSRIRSVRMIHIHQGHPLDVDRDHAGSSRYLYNVNTVQPINHDIPTHTLVMITLDLRHQNALILGRKSRGRWH